jgi:DNA helicase HerA-like ATPase
MAKTPALYLGSTRALEGAGAATDLRLPAHHFVTHGVVVGMTGSGKTGLTTVVIEEAINTGVPVLVIDVKGERTTWPGEQPNIWQQRAFR